MKIYLGNQSEEQQSGNGQEQITETAEITDNAQTLETEQYAKRFGDRESAQKVRRDFLYEDKSKRDGYTKHYVSNNGTTTAIYSGRAVHYFDEAEKRMKTIDSSLVESDDSLDTVSNAFRTSFKKSAQDGTVYELTKGNSKVRLISGDLAANGKSGANCVCEVNAETASRVAFGNVKNGVDLRYTVDSERVKEDIIVGERADGYEYNFDVGMENLEVGVSEDGATLQLKDKDSGETKFYIPAPFMTDAAGNRSDLVYYEIEDRTDDELHLKVVADKSWMNAEERAFPVTIDPQIVSVGADSPILSYEYYVRKERKGSANSTIEYWEKITPSDYVEMDENAKLVVTVNKRALSLPDNSIISAKLLVLCDRGGDCYVNGEPQFLLWREFTKIDITDEIRSDTDSYTVTFTNKAGNYNICFCLAGANCIQLEVECLENQIKPEYKSIALCGGVNGEMNVGTGELLSQFSDIEAGSIALPLGISHVHKLSDNDYGCGKDWRLNLHRKLDRAGDDYFYTDGSGNVHSFSDIYYYTDEQGRHTVDKRNVHAEQNGLLTYDNKIVTRELRTAYGLRLVTRLDGLKNISGIEQRQQDEKQLDENVKSYKAYINDLCAVDKDTGKVITSYSESSAQYICNMSSTPYLFMNSSEAAQYKSLLANRDSMQFQYDNYDKINSSGKPVEDASNLNSEERLEAKNLLNKQLQGIKNQIAAIQNSASERFRQAKTACKEYLTQSEQLFQLKRRLPTAYLTDDGGKIMCFNAVGNLCAIVDGYENYLAVEWTMIPTAYGTKEVITAVCDDDRITSLSYDNCGRLTSITSPNGSRAEYTYTDGTKTATLKKAEFSDGRSVTFDYSAGGNITAVYGNDRTFAELQYNVLGVPTRITHKSLDALIADGADLPTTDAFTAEAKANALTVGMTSIAYVRNNYASLTSNGNTEMTFVGYDGSYAGGYTKINGKINDLTVCSRAERQYDLTVRPKKTAEMDSVKTPLPQDIDDRIQKSLVKIDNIPGITKEYSDYNDADYEFTLLDEFNRPTVTRTNWRKTGVYGNVNTYAYTEITYTYAADNPEYPCIKKTVTTYTNRNGSKSTAGAEKTVAVEKYTYCEHGNLVKTESYIEGEEGTSGISVTEKVCDSKGNIIKEFSYNTLDSSTKFYTESEVAENGKVTAEIDETGENKTAIEYVDGKNAVKSRTLPNGSKLAYGYDDNGNVTAITQSTADGEENSTNTKYTLNCPTRLTSGNNVVYYEYDGKRRKTKVTCNGTETTYAYAGSKYDETESVNSPESVIADTAFASQAADKVTATRNNVTVETYKDKDGNDLRTFLNGELMYAKSYNEGKLIASGDNVTGSTVKYTYATDVKTQLKKVVVSAGTNVEALTEDYSYNERGELATRTLNGAVDQEYAYAYKNNAARDIEYITLPNTLRVYPKKDVNGRNTGKELTDANGNKVYGEYIAYRKAGDHGTNMPSAVWYANGEAIRESVKYTYDKMGNICGVSENGKPTVKYTYDTLNRLVREDNRRLGKTYLYSYDNNGNIISKRVTAYTVKAEDEITAYEKEIPYAYSGDRLLSFGDSAITYDAFGNPLNYKGNTLEWQYGKRLTKYGDNTFTYDGYGRRLAKDNTVYTYDGNGKLIKQTDGEDTLEFVYDHAGISGVNYNGINYLYRKNVLGDITQILKTDGTTVAEYAYDAWGNCTVTKDTEGIAELNPYRYRSYYYDSETHLYYLITRYYDPETGRFISQDDVTYLDPEHINGLNLYAYCRSNPVMYVDPEGMFVWLIAIIQALVVIAVNALAGAISGGITAAANGESFWKGFGAGAIAGAVQGVFVYIGFVLGPIFPVASFGLNVFGRGAASAIYGVLNEYFQYGSLEKMDWEGYVKDIIVDMGLSVFYAKAGSILSTIFSSLKDLLIDIIEAILSLNDQDNENEHKQSSIWKSFKRALGGFKASYGIS